MKVIFDKNRLENREFEDIPLEIYFGFNTLNIRVSDLLGFIEDLIEVCYELEEKEEGLFEVPYESGILNVRFVKNTEKISIFLNNNLIEKIEYSKFLSDLNNFFNDVVPILKKVVVEEIKEGGIDSPYVIVLGKIYEWQEDFYELIDSSTL